MANIAQIRDPLLLLFFLGEHLHLLIESFFGSLYFFDLLHPIEQVYFEVVGLLAPDGPLGQIGLTLLKLLVEHFLLLLVDLVDEIQQFPLHY